MNLMKKKEAAVIEPKIVNNLILKPQPKTINRKDDNKTLKKNLVSSGNAKIKFGFSTPNKNSDITRSNFFHE